ncbi:hypothetical protein [Methanosarcina sp. UBA289]|uniref:hypothetical protein n=1 Tax=Methanosarcina sp. UBA289 TaxID=1915574 RepID=UPI0025EAFAA7|nr:hypothetical protein [Methanosarcina sp. UBA289]
MRAIISCTTPLSNEEIIAILSDINWVPNTCVNSEELPQLEKDIAERKEEIFINIPLEIITTLKATTFATIYDGDTKTWGIVTRTNKYRITFRLKNPISSRLKKACESLVSQLRSDIPYKTLKNKLNNEAENTHEIFNEYNKVLFKLSTPIQILEKDTDHESFYGEILNESLIKATMADKSNQAIIVLSSGLVTLLLFVVTSPYCSFIFSGKWLIPLDWAEWLDGILGRVSTATLVTFFVGLLELYLYWVYLTKVAPIRWVTE